MKWLKIIGVSLGVLLLIGFAAGAVFVFEAEREIKEKFEQVRKGTAALPLTRKWTAMTLYRKTAAGKGP